MRKASLVLAACLIASLAPSPAFAWGSAAHRYITRRAIDLLPPELKPFFEHYRDEIVLRSTDPDVWRTAGWEDDPNHFINFGVPEFGPYPFTALPRDLGAAIEKFGMATLRKDGMLPWREQEEFGNLRRAFEGFTRHAGYAPGDVVLFAAVAAHYIQDAEQPLHATNNYDGQLTGQYGVHSRFESGLFERFESKMTIAPAGSRRDREHPRRDVRHPARELPARRSRAGGRQGRHRRQGHLRRRVLRRVLRRGAARDRAAARRVDHEDGRALAERVGAGGTARRRDHDAEDAAESSDAGSAARRAMTVYLVPIGRGRLELYSEAPDEPRARRRRSGRHPALAARPRTRAGRARSRTRGSTTEVGGVW